MNDALFQEAQENNELLKAFGKIPAPNKRAFLALLPRHLKDCLLRHAASIDENPRGQPYAKLLADTQQRYTQMLDIENSKEGNA
jgi:hypothetical protein